MARDQILIDAVNELTELVQRGEEVTIESFLARNPGFQERGTAIRSEWDNLPESQKVDHAAHGFLRIIEDGGDVAVRSYVARKLFCDLAPRLETAIVDAWAEHPSIDGYEIYHKLGRGSFGDVWLARELAGNELRALKIVREVGNRKVDVNGVEEALACLQGTAVAELFVVPHASPARGTDRVGNYFYYTMQCADGVDGSLDPQKPKNEPITLSRRIRNGDVFTTQEVIALGQRLVEAIAFLHDRERRHLDIKPSNIIQIGGEWKIADVGLLEKFDLVFERRYTPGYFCHGEPVNSRFHDIYAIGTTLFQIKTSTCSPVSQTAWDKYHGEEETIEKDAKLRRIVQRARACKYDDAKQLLQDLEDAASTGEEHVSALQLHDATKPLTQHLETAAAAGLESKRDATAELTRPSSNRWIRATFAAMAVLAIFAGLIFAARFLGPAGPIRGQSSAQQRQQQFAGDDFENSGDHAVSQPISWVMAERASQHVWEVRTLQDSTTRPDDPVLVFIATSDQGCCHLREKGLRLGTSVNPCPLCHSAAYWAGIEEIYYCLSAKGRLIGGKRPSGVAETR